MGRYAPELVFLFYPGISQNILRIVGGFFSVFPIAMWEILALTAFVWMVYTLIRDISELHIVRWVSGVVLFLAISIFAMTLLWGLNHYSPPMHEKLGLSGQDPSLSQLKMATIYYRDKANEAARNVKRDENGNLDYGTFRELGREASDCYTILSLEYDCFRGPRYQPKRLILGELLGIDGLFVPFTGESGASVDIHSVCLPFVMCREIGHGCGFTDRGEAEFAAFLACMESDSAAMRYSGYFNAFSLCYNALYQENPSAAQEIWNGVSQTVRTDCTERLALETQAWTKTMDHLQEGVRDAYAKTFQYEEKTPDHDTATDLLTMWYLEEIL